MRPVVLLTLLCLLPAGAAEGATCKRVEGRIGYHAKDVRATGGARCTPIRRRLKAWLDGPVAERIAGPRGWSCARRSTRKQIAYDCDPGRGRVRFVLRFAVG